MDGHAIVQAYGGYFKRPRLRCSMRRAGSCLGTAERRRTKCEFILMGYRQKRNGDDADGAALAWPVTSDRCLTALPRRK